MTPGSKDGGSPGGFAPPQTDLGPRTSDIGLFLHASAVVIDGGACLFLGHSTAGKSTIARLLGKDYPVLADDSVYAVRRSPGEETTNEPRDERRLAELAKAGDEEAFAELVRGRTDSVVAFLRRMLGDTEDARDVAQLAFLHKTDLFQQTL